MIDTMPSEPRSVAYFVAVAAIVFSPTFARAGMPYPPTLTDLSQLRVEAISFFMFVFLVSAFGVQRLWNQLRSGFPRLPKLTYGKAVGLVALWGLLFIVVLAMISGARELMTPGAWEKQGATYRLTGDKQYHDDSR